MNPAKNRLLKIPVKSLLCFLALLCAVSLLTGCRPDSDGKQSQTGFYLNTVITVTVYDIPSDELLNGCMELAGSYEKLFSRTLEGSDVWNINHSGGKPVTVQPETLALLKTALSYAERSGGLVDPSIGTLSILWNFGDDNEGIVPSVQEISNALSHVNYKNITISGNQVSLSDPLSCVDLGFIAKGYIADRMKEYLIKNDVKSAVINLGGNVLTIGSKPDGTPFKIGIQKPFAPSGTTVLSLEAADSSVVSSGSYERCFTSHGKLYHHILSTKDGYPVNSGLSQVTVLCRNSVDGDALSTLCFILGYEKGRELIESLEDTEAIFIMENGEIRKTF